jgi:hypothetical protein
MRWRLKEGHKRRFRSSDSGAAYVIFERTRIFGCHGGGNGGLYMSPNTVKSHRG